jgi:hypothetical protein
MSSPANTWHDRGHVFTPPERLAVNALPERLQGLSERLVWELHPRGGC